MHERAAYLIITFMGSPPGCPDPAWTSTGVEVGTAVIFPSPASGLTGASMNKELYVSSTPHETKVALTEDDQLAEVFFERENEYTLAGSIYKGRVTRVLPGMQSAFVDIGLERDAFLYVSDFLELSGEDDEDGEFGEIPAPRGAIEFGKPPQSQEFQSPEAQTAATVSADDNDADLEPMFDEEAPAPMEGQAESISVRRGRWGWRSPLARTPSSSWWTPRSRQ